jgi:glycerate 2-kinase
VSDVQTLRTDAQAIFTQACARVHAATCLRRVVKITGDDVLTVGERSYDLHAYERILAVGAGKASAAMAQALEEVLGARLSGGHINTKYGFAVPLKLLGLSQAAHPIPDAAGIEGTQRMVELIRGADEKTLIFFLASGGGSALMPFPVEGVSLAEKQRTTGLLLGANIKELNAVRKHLSQVKGGQFARAAFPATVISLMVSDVIGDPLDVIASGPTVADASTFGNCHDILRAHGVLDKVPDSVRLHIERGVAGDIPETPKPGDAALAQCQNLVIANIDDAVQAARMHAEKLGYTTLVLSKCIEGEARDVAHIYTALAAQIKAKGKPVAPPACIIAGGETTVGLLGEGRDGYGGRNQALALAGAMDMAGYKNTLLFSGGTDGDDGVKFETAPNVAGAMADGDTVERGRALGMEAADHLDANNAYPFFEALGDHVLSGPTQTNVMDLALLLVGEGEKG